MSLETLRDAVVRRVADTGLRHAAREIGVSYQAVRGLVDGAEPYAKNLAKLRDWYSRETNELLRLRQEVTELRRRLAECEGRKGKR